MVICNKHKTCRISRDDPYGCGGAKPHDLCNECGKCPFDKTATCIEFIENKTN